MKREDPTTARVRTQHERNQEAHTQIGVLTTKSLIWYALCKIGEGFKRFFSFR
jgi:hypothetical protein